MENKIIEDIMNLLLNNYGEATQEGKEKIEKNISLYANDYVKNYIEQNNYILSKKQINNIIEKIIIEFNRL